MAASKSSARRRLPGPPPAERQAGDLLERCDDLALFAHLTQRDIEATSPGLVGEAEFDTMTNPSGSGEVRERITVDGDELRGKIEVTIFDATGAVVFTDDGNLTAHRVETDD
jgi:hypothetical protein